jgi:hypothetical protein
MQNGRDLRERDEAYFAGMPSTGLHSTEQLHCEGAGGIPRTSRARRMLGGLNASASVSMTIHCRRERVIWRTCVRGLDWLLTSVVMDRFEASKRNLFHSIFKTVGIQSRNMLS